MKIMFYDPKYAFAIKDPSYPVGGATIQLKNWVEGFSKMNVEVMVMTLDIPDLNYNDANGTKLIPAYVNSRGIKVLRWLYYRIPSIYKKIKQYQPEIIIQAKASFISGVLALLCKILKITFIYRVANDIETDGRLILKTSSIDSKIFTHSLKYASAIICQNQYQKQQLMQLFPRKVIEIIYNPFYISEGDDKINQNRSYIAWIGIFQSQKNLPGLYEIIKSLPHQKFKIAGKSFDALDQQSMEALDHIKLCPNAELIGYLSKKEVPGFLSNAYLLLNTSHYEGFSNTFLEAFAMGTPVVARKKVDPDLTIFNNKLGRSVELQDELPDAIISLVEDPDYFMICSKCREYVKAHHNLEKLSQDYLRIISDVRR